MFTLQIEEAMEVRFSVDGESCNLNNVDFLCDFKMSNLTWPASVTHLTS